MANAQTQGASSVEHATMEYLWNAANELKAVAPSISRRLAATLVSSVPEDAMSSFAKRKHCNKCAALMNTSKVRVRKVVKKTRRRPESFRNIIISTCEHCGTHNVQRGVSSYFNPRADEAEMKAFRKSLRKEAKKGKKGEQAKPDEADRGTAGAEQATDGTHTGTKPKKKKTRKRKRSTMDGNEAHAAAPRSGLAASFLFDPL